MLPVDPVADNRAVAAVVDTEQSEEAVGDTELVAEDSSLDRPEEVQAAGVLDKRAVAAEEALVHQVEHYLDKDRALVVEDEDIPADEEVRLQIKK